MHEKRGEKHVISMQCELQKLEFFHNIFYGSKAHLCAGWKSSDNIFHSDAPVAIVITRKGKVSGVVGFEIIGSTMLVRQIQGAPKGNFNDGTQAGEYILGCAEQIAVTLGVKTLRIVTPETAIAYRESAPPQDRPSTVAKSHMEKMYSFPGKLGYRVSYFWRVRRPTFFRELS